MLPLLARCRSSNGAGAAQHVQFPWAFVRHLQQQCCSSLDTALHHQQQQQQNLYQQSSGFCSSSSSKQLSDILKIDLLQHKTADDIEDIWLSHHADSPSHIASAMGKDEHLVVMARAAASPLFVLPLAKRPGTFQTLLLQWQPPNRLLFTTVDEFKQWGPQAPPHLTVQLYDELADSHGVVLLRGDLINTGLINAAEGRTLLELTRAFYRDSAAHRMVYAFNHTPGEFDFQELCRELGISAAAAAANKPPPTHEP